MSTDNPDMVFMSVGHLIDKEMLKDCNAKMDGDKAVGIDGVTKAEYERDLDSNLDNLIEKKVIQAQNGKKGRNTKGQRKNKRC